MAANTRNLLIGIIGNRNGRSLCSALGRTFDESHLRTDRVLTFCVSDTTRVHLIDIDISWSRIRRQAVRDLSHCDVIIYLISAVDSKVEAWNQDTFRKMRRYLQIGHVFGAKHFIIAIDQMDNPSNQYSEQIFNEMKERVKENLDKTNVEDYRILPIAVSRDLKNVSNISTKSMNMQWYNGPTLRDIIDSIQVNEDPVEQKPFKNVVRFSAIIHIQRWCHDDQKYASELRTKRRVKNENAHSSGMSTFWTLTPKNLSFKFGKCKSFSHFRI